MTSIHDEHSYRAINNMRVEYSNSADIPNKHTQYVMMMIHDEHP
jgi:hypothetical protein